LFGLAISEQPRACASAQFSDNRDNVMFYTFYDIFAEAIAAQCFPASSLLVDVRKCHEMCGCVTFHDIFCPVPSTPQSDEAAAQSIPH
jgi:hypothetical protein